MSFIKIMLHWIPLVQIFYGIDYLSISTYEDTELPHRILLSAGIILLEGLDLSDVDGGFYQLYCLPLKLGGCEGAPARAILVEI